MTDRPFRAHASRSARDLSRKARAAIAGGLPTVPIALRGQETGPDDAQTRQVIDLALRVGESLLATGASAADTTGVVLRLTHAYDLRSVHVDITYSSITISHHRGPDLDPITVMRVVAVLQQDFTRLQRLQRLVRDAEAGDLPVAEARARLDEISHAPHPYSRAVVSIATMLLGASVAALLDGGIFLMVVSALTTTAVERTVRWLGAHQVPPFFGQAAGAAIPTIVAMTLNYLANNVDVRFLRDLRPSVVVASGVVVLLAGLATVGAAQDTIDGFYVTASGRTFEVLILSGGIVAGVLGVVAIAQRLGVSIVINPSLTWSTSLTTGVVAAAVIALASAVMGYAGPRTALLAAGVGAIAWTVYAAMNGLEVTPAVSSGAAALAVGALATILGWRLNVPSLAIASASIVPLLPGLTVYRGVFELVNQDLGPSFGISTLLGALFIGLAIASGVTLGSLPGRLRRPEVISRKRAPEVENA